MRIAIISESFPPDVNGVANSVARVAEQLVARGHLPLVVAPEPGSVRRRVAGRHPYPVVRVPSVPAPRYRGFRLGLPTAALADAVTAHAPDVVHLASPFVVGARGAGLAARLRVPCVAVYQTDVPAYLRAYRLRAAEAAAWRWLRRIHNGAARTLAPSRAAAAALTAHGIERVWLWRRGVDTVRFGPEYRSARLRALLAPAGELIVGYVGRLATEKRVDLLAQTCRLPGVRVVVVGDGPARAGLTRALPGAVFLGERHGEQLARIYASLDLFVHTGPHETFGQTVQEALASGLPVVAPAAGGPMDLVAPGQTGALVPPGDGAAIAAAVAALAAEPDRRAAYGQAARVAVAGRGWGAVTDQLIGHYRAVLGVGVPADGISVRPEVPA
jgi:phosphatidylinositol alpha 1,6-mannosyltransferase